MDSDHCHEPKTRVITQTDVNDSISSWFQPIEFVDECEDRVPTHNDRCLLINTVIITYYDQ